MLATGLLAAGLLAAGLLAAGLFAAGLLAAGLFTSGLFATGLLTSGLWWCVGGIVGATGGRFLLDVADEVFEFGAGDAEGFGFVAEDAFGGGVDAFAEFVDGAAGFAFGFGGFGGLAVTGLLFGFFEGFGGAGGFGASDGIVEAAGEEGFARLRLFGDLLEALDGVLEGFALPGDFLGALVVLKVLLQALGGGGGGIG